MQVLKNGVCQGAGENRVAFLGLLYPGHFVYTLRFWKSGADCGHAGRTSVGKCLTMSSVFFFSQKN